MLTIARLLFHTITVWRRFPKNRSLSKFCLFSYLLNIQVLNIASDEHRFIDNAFWSNFCYIQKPAIIFFERIFWLCWRNFRSQFYTHRENSERKSGEFPHRAKFVCKYLRHRLFVFHSTHFLLKQIFELIIFTLGQNLLQVEQQDANNSREDCDPQLVGHERRIIAQFFLAREAAQVGSGLLVLIGYDLIAIVFFAVKDAAKSSRVGCVYVGVICVSAFIKNLSLIDI